MANCVQHPERLATAPCDGCDRPACDECLTQLAELPESYRLCPSCLESLEDLVESGLDSQTRNVPRLRAWLGAGMGCLMAIAVWLPAVTFVAAEWSVPVRWIGGLLCGAAAGVFATRLSGNRRGAEVTRAALGVGIPALLAGHVLSANLVFRNYILGDAANLERLVRAGWLPADPGWFVPMGVLRMVWHSLEATDLAIILGMDAIVVLASAFLAYAFTSRRRLRRAGPGSAG